MIDDRAVLALRRVLLERHPRPHDLARIGVAVERGVYSMRTPAVDRSGRRLPAGASCARRPARRCATDDGDALDQPTRESVEPSAASGSG